MSYSGAFQQMTSPISLWCAPILDSTICILFCIIYMICLHYNHFFFWKTSWFLPNQIAQQRVMVIDLTSSFTCVVQSVSQALNSLWRVVSILSPNGDVNQTCWFSRQETRAWKMIPSFIPHRGHIHSINLYSFLDQVCFYWKNLWTTLPHHVVAFRERLTIQDQIPNLVYLVWWWFQRLIFHPSQGVPCSHRVNHIWCVLRN